MFLYIDNNSILVTESCPGTRSFDQCVASDSTSTKAVGRKEFLNEPHGPLVPSLEDYKRPYMMRGPRIEYVHAAGWIQKVFVQSL